MSSNKDGAYKTTLTSLPTELITRIVRLSSPKPSWDNATKRFKHLRNLALVCQAFRGPAQEELFRHVVLPSVAASRAFVAVLKSRAGARFASTPRSLRAGEWDEGGDDETDQHKFALSFIAKRCSRLESMYLRRIDPLDVVAVASGPPGLKELLCCGCMFFPTIHGSKTKALSLTRLGIRDCGGVSSLDPYIFTNVKSLDISLADPDERDDMNTFANSLGEQLSSLCVGDAFERVPSLDGFKPSSFKSLRCLDTRLYPEEYPLLLSSLPSRIRHLRVQAPAPLSYELMTSAEHYEWALKFIQAELGKSMNSCLERLDHIRYGTYDPGRRRAMSNERVQELEDELKALSMHARLSLDDLEGRSTQDKAFNPAFWAFVDDAAAEEARTLEEI